MSSRVCRREFLRRGFQAAVASAVGAKVPSAGAETGLQELNRGGMVYRRLGKTDLFVSLLGFGSHTDRRYQLPAPWGTRLNEEGQVRRDRQISRAIDLGVNLVDVYAVCGQWEPMARLVKGKRDRVILSLKKELPGPTADIIDSGAKLFGCMDLFRFVIYDQNKLTAETLEKWDVVRKGKGAGKIRAIGIATHDPDIMLRCLSDLEGLDFILFPYNFIHDRVAYHEFLPAAAKQSMGLLAMKPLGTGSITQLDPRRPRLYAQPEGEELSLNLRDRAPLLEQAIKKLTEELDRSPDETLAQAALRYVFSKPFISCALPGMWLDEEVEENHQALAAYACRKGTHGGALQAAYEVADLSHEAWLPKQYRWLDQKWKSHQCPPV